MYSMEMSKVKKIDIVYESLIQLFNEKNKGISAEEIAEKIDIQRTNASSYLNLLCKQNKIEKINSRPVVFLSLIHIFFHQK